MSILTDFFYNNKFKREKLANKINGQQTTVEETLSKNIPPIDLFIDNDSPQSEHQAAVETQSKITVFLNRNYHSIGTYDGYEYHSQETLEIGMKKIRAEFQLIIDQSTQEKCESRLQLKNLIVHVGQIADKTRETLENTIEELNSSLSLLHKQKELSSENEGWVMNAIHSYHQGFVQGLNDYISGENLLNSIKNF